MSSESANKRLDILRSVRQTCSDLAAKLEQLHHQVIRPVEKAKNAVTHTMDTVQGTVVQAKQLVDTAGKHIARYPWLSVTGSMFVGMGTGYLTKSTTVSTPSVSPWPASTSAEAPKPSRLGSFVQTQLNKLTDLSVGAGLALVRDVVKERMPEWSDAADHLARDLTHQLGAVPFHGPLLQPVNTVSEPVSSL